ncbi:MAG: glycosyltransferase family 39 protein [Bdellovibrio sp.]|nr:glycosyltransferase family 39 protein [Bdellovibrio sp.]
MQQLTDITKPANKLKENYMKNHHSNNINLTWTLLGTIFLFIFAKFSEPGLGISSTTYGALARDILENAHWFNPTVGHKMNDPLVDHPYLVLWIDAIFFKLFGVSAQTIRLTSSLLGMLGFVALFRGVKNILGENAAYLSCVLLMTINVYMNYHSSGWLDIPMVSFCLFAFYFVSKEGFSPQNGALSGLMISCAVLSKGAGALAVFPIFLFSILQSKNKVRDFIIISTCALLPFLAFTIAHYNSQRFLFWTVYFQRQFGALNDTDAQLASTKHYFWYVLESLRNGHLVAILSLPGLWWLTKAGHKKIAALIGGVLVVHISAYSMSSRHYGQYLLPLFPWMAVAAAFFLTSLLKHKLKIAIIAKYLLILAMVFFVTTEILPIQVHSASGTAFKSLQKILYFNPQLQVAYFAGDVDDQSTWEAESSYIRWYLNKWPVALKEQELRDKIASLTENEVILAPKGFAQTPPCAHSSKIDVYLKNCMDLKVNVLSFSDQNQYLP